MLVIPKPVCLVTMAHVEVTQLWDILMSEKYKTFISKNAVVFFIDGFG